MCTVNMYVRFNSIIAETMLMLLLKKIFDINWDYKTRGVNIGPQLPLHAFTNTHKLISLDQAKWWVSQLDLEILWERGF